MEPQGSSRRSVIAALGSGSAFAGAALKPSVPARSAARVLGANDRIQTAQIGVGGNGTGMLRAMYAQSQNEGDVAVVAVSDIYTRRKERAREAAKLEARNVHHDYREILERDDVDAVFISTPDHWHAQMAIDAMAAGKDVYLQKPMTLTIPEARAVWEAAKKYQRVLQVGSQHLSDLRYHRAREVILNGDIGELLWAQTTYSRNSRQGEWNYYIDEEGTAQNIDWPRWLGTAPKRPFSAERYFRWRKYWDYSGGIATDLFYHRLGPVVYAMSDASGTGQYPVRVSAAGGIYVQKDREVPDTYQTTVEYDKFFVNISSSMANGAANQYFTEVIYGSKGTLSLRADRIVVEPEAVWGKSPAREIPVDQGKGILRGHTDDFLAAMRTRGKTRLNPEMGYKIMIAIKLGVDAYREGKTKHWDAAQHRVSERAAARPGYEGDGKNGEFVRERAR